MMESITGHKSVMWGPSIIGFGTYRYQYESGREGDWFLVGFSPRKTSISLYIGRFDGRDELLVRLGKHKTGKACVYINKLADVDREVLKELIRKSMEQSSGLC